MNDFSEVVLTIILYGIFAFLLVASVVLWIVSIVWTLLLVVEITGGHPVPWFHIVAPFVTFIGIGTVVYLMDN